MSAIETSAVTRCPARGTSEAFRRDVLRGLRSRPKWISSKHLYDKRGSELFEQICELDEYYVTRCELDIMRRHSAAMAGRFGGPVRLVEFGSGSSLKTRLLIDQLAPDSIYLPVDVSWEHLEESCAALRREYPSLEVTPVHADFTEPLDLPVSQDRDLRTVVYFPGSTIGNLEHRDAIDLMRSVADLTGAGGDLLIGVDLRKDPAMIHAAYNDRRGVTARFTKNLLTRFNRELDAEFDLDAFDYRASYNIELGRIEASLVSRLDQAVRVDDQLVVFNADEPIHTEYSHKYSVDQFQTLAARAGFVPVDEWTDARRYFSVMLLRHTR